MNLKINLFRPFRKNVLPKTTVPTAKLIPPLPPACQQCTKDLEEISARLENIIKYLENLRDNPPSIE